VTHCLYVSSEKIEELARASQDSGYCNKRYWTCIFLDWSQLGLSWLSCNSGKGQFPFQYEIGSRIYEWALQSEAVTWCRWRCDPGWNQWHPAPQEDNPCMQIKMCSLS
jgi:hypothetical protein